MHRHRIGVVGFGHLGAYLVQKILENPEHFELAFVWNRTRSNIPDDAIPDNNLILESLDDIDPARFAAESVDLIVEVANAEVTKTYGESFLKIANYMIGSPTTLANDKIREQLQAAAQKYDRSVFIPSGAFWGGEDIRKMADLGTLKSLSVTMKKHPLSLKLNSPLKEVNEKVAQSGQPVVLYEGSVRSLCPLAPSNVNTMSVAAIAGYNLGFDNVIGRLVSDPSLTDCHIVEVDVTGPTTSDGNVFSVRTVRRNPAEVGAVTGSATYDSFWASLKNACKPLGRFTAKAARNSSVLKRLLNEKEHR